MLIDCHQHLWPPRLIAELRRRTGVPCLRGRMLFLAGEPPYEVDPAAHDVEARRAREVADGRERVLVSLSSPLGIEHLPARDGGRLIEVWHESALELGEPFRVWAAASVTELDPSGLAEVLRHERVAGLQLPATALADPAGIARLRPLLDEAERAGKPVLVHPGPAAPTRTPAHPGPASAAGKPVLTHPGPAATGGDSGLPGWWPALVPYVAQLHQSWMAWHVAGRRQHPRLRIAFVALAGLAPLHHERLAARGGALGPLDPGVFYETSSYGARAIDAMVRVVGADPIVHGSDRPYAEPVDPGLGAAFSHALFTANPHHLLTGEPR